MPRPPAWPAAAALTPILMLVSQGCAPKMTAADSHKSKPVWDTRNRVEDGPFRFWSHNLGVYAFSTWGCRVTYGSRVVHNDPVDKWNRPYDSYPTGIAERMRSGQGPFRNDEGRMVIEWHDASKVARRADIDVPDLLRSGLIPHSVPLERILPGVTILPPELIVEVNDRAVRLYLVSRIPLRDPPQPPLGLTPVKIERFMIFEDLDAGTAS